MSLDPVRHGQGFLNPGELPGNAAFIRHIVEQNGEFIPAEPGDHITLADNLCDAERSLLQDSIAEIMAEGIVHRLEMIQINEDQHDLAVTALDGGNGFI